MTLGMKFMPANITDTSYTLLSNEPFLIPSQQ